MSTLYEYKYKDIFIHFIIYLFVCSPHLCVGFLCLALHPPSFLCRLRRHTHTSHITCALGVLLLASGAPSCRRVEDVQARGAPLVKAATVICNYRARFPHIGDGAAIGVCDHGVQFACVEDGAAFVVCSQGDLAVLSSRHAMSCHMSCHVTSCCMWCRVASCRVGHACHVTSCHVVSHRVMSCHIMSCHVISMSCHVMSCHVMSCHVISYQCHVVSCRVVSCRGVSRRSCMSCHATLRRVVSRPAREKSGRSTCHEGTAQIHAAHPPIPRTLTPLTFTQPTPLPLTFTHSLSDNLSRAFP